MQCFIVEGCRRMVVGLFCLFGVTPLVWAAPVEWPWTTPTLNITLQAAKVEVRWTRPTPGEPTSEKNITDDVQLAHYRVHFGPTSRGEALDPGSFQYKSSFKVPIDQTAVILDGFPSGQPYFVAVTALDTAGRESPYSTEQSLTVTSQLKAVFSSKPDSGEAPLTVAFTDRSKGEPESRTWHFGDGRTSTSAKPRHTYQKPGEYRARLTITGSSGSHEAVRKITVLAPKRSASRGRGKAHTKITDGRIPQANGTGKKIAKRGIPNSDHKDSGPKVKTDPLPPARSNIARAYPPSVSIPPPPSLRLGAVTRRGAYIFNIEPADYGFTYVGPGDHRSVREAAIDGDWFANRFGSVFHVTWIPANVTPDREVAYVEKSLWQAWRNVHPSMSVYLARDQIDPAPISVYDMVGSLLHYTAHVTGEKQWMDYAIRLAVFRGPDQTYACILLSPIAGSIFGRDQERRLKQHDQQAAAFFMRAVKGFRPGPIQALSAQTALPQEHEAVQVMMQAARKGDTGSIRMLLSQGAEVRAEGEQSITPLMVAAGYGHTDTVQALLQAGAQARAQAQWGATALLAAALNGHEEVVRELEVAGGTWD